MGVEVKGAGDGVVIADRGCNDGCGCRDHSGWGSGWGAVGGALVGGGFGAAAVSVWDKINDTKADIQKVESTVQEAKAGIYKDISDAARGVTQEIKCLIENTAKDQEIARLNRVVDAQRDQNIINQVVAALKGTTTPAQ
nr:MAG: hypothetical protein [Bacteriophage sp.]